LNREHSDPYDYLVAKRHCGLTGYEYEPSWDDCRIERLKDRISVAVATTMPTYEELDDALWKLLWEQTAAEYRAELVVSLSPEEARARMEQEKAEDIARAEEARSYHQKDAAADFEYYYQFPVWTLEEAVSLSFGKDPVKVNWNTVRDYEGVSSFAKMYARRRHLCLNAKLANELSEPVTPESFVAWAQRMKIDLPEVLVDRVISTQAHAPKKTSEVLGTRERTSHLKLIAVLAKCYGYDPLKKNSAAAEIKSELERLGLSLDEDTIRKYLAAAIELQHETNA
jgi:hypothetical protein